MTGQSDHEDTSPSQRNTPPGTSEHKGALWWITVKRIFWILAIGIPVTYVCEHIFSNETFEVLNAANERLIGAINTNDPTSFPKAYFSKLMEPVTIYSVCRKPNISMPNLPRGISDCLSRAVACMETLNGQGRDPRKDAVDEYIRRFTSTIKYPLNVFFYVMQRKFLSDLAMLPSSNEVVVVNIFDLLFTSTLVVLGLIGALSIFNYCNARWKVNNHPNIFATLFLFPLVVIAIATMLIGPLELLLVGASRLLDGFTRLGYLLCQVSILGGTLWSLVAKVAEGLIHHGISEKLHLK